MNIARAGGGALKHRSGFASAAALSEPLVA